MPCAVDYILEGLAKSLEVDRECGSFTLEFDRTFLASLPKERTVKAAESVVPADTPRAAPATTKVAAPKASGIRRASGIIAAAAGTPARDDRRFDFVFLHHAAMTGSSATMMANVITKGIRKTPETAPVVYEGERPPAKIYVVLGAKALNRWYEGVSLANGAWFRDVDSEVFYTWSPDDIYRYGDNLSPALVQKKRDMWKGLQEGMRKISAR